MANKACLLSAFAKILSSTLCDDQQKDKSAVGDVFSELDELVRAANLPVASIVLLDQKYKELTGRALRQDLPEAHIDSYNSAFQLAIDLMYVRSVPIQA